MLHGQPGSTGSLHVKASREKLCLPLFHGQTPHALHPPGTRLLAQPRHPSACGPGKLQIPLGRQEAGMIKQNPLLDPSSAGEYSASWTVGTTADTSFLARICICNLKGIWWFLQDKPKGRHGPAASAHPHIPLPPGAPVVLHWAIESFQRLRSSAPSRAAVGCCKAKEASCKNNQAALIRSDGRRRALVGAESLLWQLP